MALYYRYKSERFFDSIAINVPFISVSYFKQRIFESKRYGWGNDFDLVVINAHTNEEYLDEAMLIPKNSAVLIRRVPGWPRKPMVADRRVPEEENKMVNAEPEKSSLPATVASTMIDPEDSEWNDFWNDVNGPSNPTVETPPTNIADEESKIKALIDTPALDCQCQGPDGFGPSRGFERGIGGKMGGHGFGFEWETPPQGYVCHRCKVPGHFIQHCRTNGDPKFDIERVKPPTDIPKSLLMATPDGSYALSSGAVAVLEPNGAAFEKEMEGVPSTYSVGELPPELYCRLCKEVLKDAVLAKCCFESFCEKCIRNHIISKTTCVCGKKNIVADDLLPNKTLRHTINRILEGGSSSSENAGSTFPVRGMESARLLPKVPSPTLSAASKGEQKQSPVSEETPKIHETGDEGKAATFPQRTAKKGTQKAADLSEFPHESVSVREITSSLESAPLAEEEVHQKVPTSEAGKKKEKKKARIPAIDLQWKTSRDLAAENNIMPSGPSAFNPYWTGMQPGAMAYMGYGIRPFDMPFGGIAPQDPFGAQGYMFTPIPPQREFSNDWEFGGVVNRVADVPSTKLKSKNISPLSSAHCHRPAKRKLEHYADKEVSKKKREAAGVSPHSTCHRPTRVA